MVMFPSVYRIGGLERKGMRLQFEPKSLRKKREYLTFFAKCPQMASDYSFVNIWGWAEEYGLLWTWDNDLVWIKQTKPRDLFWAPIGAWDSVHWKERFVENNQNIKTGLELVEFKGNRDDGLRKAKLSYHPTDFVRKYRVSFL